MSDAPVHSLPTPGDLDGLTALFREARYVAMEQRARELLASNPRSGMLWKALAVALRVQRKDALEASRTAAELSPVDAEAQANLGAEWLERGRFDQAVASYERVLAVGTATAGVHRALGDALRGCGRREEALQQYHLALERDAASVPPTATQARTRADTCFLIGNVLLELERSNEACEWYRRALEARPDFVEAHCNLGSALRGMGSAEEALHSIHAALSLHPEYAPAHGQASDVLRDLGLPVQAAASARHALDIDARSAGAHNALGNALLDLGELAGARTSYERAIAVEPHFIAAIVNLAMVQRLAGESGEAEANCRRALTLEPRTPAALILSAELQADRGEFTTAEATFELAARIDPDSPESCAGIAHLRRMTSSDAHWLQRAQRLVASKKPARQEAYLRYALGKYFDDIEAYDEAFGHYRRANELTKQWAPRFDRAKMSREIDATIARVHASREKHEPHELHGLTDGARFAADSARAVFIVGMPRSGTSLAEQILASHPAVVGAGELPFWGDVSARDAMAEGDGVGSGASVDLGALAATYLRQLDSLSGTALRIVDKMPANFRGLGLIHAALPHGRIIHMRRDPRDTCLSIYFQHFKAAHAYGNDLQDLAHYYEEYRRLMQHWRAALPRENLLEVDYEALVRQPEAWSRKLVEFIGLPWDARCLDFHKTERTVLTASKWQVRQAMNIRSVDRWRHYAHFLGPLEGLAARA